MSGAATSHRPLPWAQYWIPACFGFAVLMLGYVPLLLFWELGANPAGVPGLFHYRDATWGDPHPSPNWTLPAPHDFTAPGKWHAAFLIAASAFFAAAWVELFRRIRASEVGEAAEILASPVTAGAVACTAAYAWLAAADSARAAQTASGRGSLLALAASAVALIACLTWAARGSLAQAVRTAVAGLLVAVALVVFFDTYGRTGSFMLITALTG